MAKLIFGCGYLGSRVAQRWLSQGHQVYAVTRSPQRATHLVAAGLTPLVADVLRPDTLTALPPAETVLFAVGHDQSTGYSTLQLHADGLKNVLSVLNPDIVQRVIYISSTGVYGKTGGEIVDEDTPCEPMRDGGRASLEAERQLQSHPMGAKGLVLRLAGIYGPGRVPRRDELLAGKPIVASPVGYLNLIHVDDAADVVLSVEQRAQPPRTYVVCDNHPTVRREYFEEIAKIYGAPQPRFQTAGVNENPRSASDKRASNARLTREIGVSLSFPSFREGLAAILRAETG